MRPAGLAASLVLAGVLLGAPPAHAAVVCSNETAGVTAPAANVIWDIAAQRLDALTGPSTLPFGATGRSTYRRTNAYAWTAGFFPTSLWLRYGHTRNAADLQQARTYTDRVLRVASWHGSHDLGFMVGLPALTGIANDPDATRRQAYEQAVVVAAQSLSTRFNGKIGAIRSGTYGGRWGLIIDSAMNAPLLIRAGKTLGGSEGASLGDQGLRHMQTLSRDLVRPDGSTIHRMAYDASSGKSLGPLPGQGLRRSSTWSRGQAWAMNGFAQAYALTNDSRMLVAARRTADFWMDAVPAGCIPAWDLAVTSTSAPRDSSAAAIAVDALLNLAAVEPDPERAARDDSYARQSLSALMAPHWVPRAAAARGLLQHQAYSIPLDSREGTYVWGDTFLLEALSLAYAPSTSG